MQIIVPEYYKNFKCIAESCLHSCCIGWEIDIDSDTYELYKNLKGDMGEKIRANISVDGTPHFILDKNERCPFLNSNGLCDIILAFGDDGLCQICYDHPRFKNEFSFGTEMGLGLCCEAAAELILNNNSELSLTVLECDGECSSLNAEESQAFEQREYLLRLFQNKEIPLGKIIQKASEIYKTAPFKARIPILVQKYRNLERLEPRWDEYLNKTEQNSAEFEFILSKAEEKIPLQARNLLCYFTYRYFATETLGNNQKGAVNFILEGTYFCLAVSLLSCDDLNPKSFANVVRLFSSETEYSEENIRLLLN